MHNLKAILAITFGYGAGLVCGAKAIKGWLLLARARRWSGTEGIIRESTLYKDPERNNATHFRIIYEFVGRRHPSCDGAGAAAPLSRTAAAHPSA